MNLFLLFFDFLVFTEQFLGEDVHCVVEGPYVVLGVLVGNVEAHVLLEGNDELDLVEAIEAVLFEQRVFSEVFGLEFWGVSQEVHHDLFDVLEIWLFFG